MVSDAQIVEQRGENGSEQRAHDRYPPEGVNAEAARRERLAAPARDEREEAGSEVPGRVDHAAGVVAEPERYDKNNQ